MAKTATPKPWRATVHLDRLEAATGRWRITTGTAHDPLPREVATAPGVRAALDAWLAAHRAKQAPTPTASAALDDALRASVTTAFQALPPVPSAPRKKKGAAAEPAPAAKPRAKS